MVLSAQKAGVFLKKVREDGSQCPKSRSVPEKGERGGLSVSKKQEQPQSKKDIEAINMQLVQV